MFLKSSFINLIIICLLLVCGFSIQSNAQTRHKVFLEQLDISKIYQGKDRPRQVGESAHISINNRKFINGFHTRTESRLYLALDGKVNTFSALVGIDGRSDENDSAKFFVIGDGTILWRSGMMKKTDAPKKCNVNVVGVRHLLLKVIGGQDHVQTDWVNGLFTYSGKPPVTTWSPDDLSINRKMPQPTSLRINGAMAVGICPGTPFLYPVAVTGKRPLKITVKGLPAGLSFNEKTGIIRGIPEKRGNYYIRLRVKNSLRSSQRTLRILVGDTLALTPPMGFLSWNVIEGLISETVVKEIADAFVKYGLRDMGYQYIVMDDCWAGYRDKNGNIHPNLIRFPHGIKALSDYLHARGLKFGLYSSPGAVTCAGYPGSLGHEAQDVHTWASWGIDYLKYDFCSAPKDKAKELYILMGRLLKSSGRSIVYGLGAGDSGAVWGEAAHAQLWRTAGDIRDQWNLDSKWGIINCFDQQSMFTKYQHPGGWNDPDMIMVGIYGKGASSNDLGAKGCTDTEYQSQMSLWSLLSAPLFISADIRNMRPSALKILTNPEVIAVDQDVLGKLPVGYGPKGKENVWVKEMADGSEAIGLLNCSNKPSKIIVNWKEIGLNGEQKVRDLWLRKNMGIFKTGYSAIVPGHGVVLIRLHSYQ